MRDVYEDLREVALFAECSRDELQKVAALGTLVSVESGQVLLREGTPGDQFIVVVEGRLGVSRMSTGPVALIGPGEFSGEMALLDHARRSATVTALTPAVVYVSNPAEFQALIEIPSIGAAVRAASVQRAAMNRTAA
jgi:CRP-like cAMP-binding protein